MGSEGSVPPSGGIPLVDAYGILGWLGHYCFLSWGNVRVHGVEGDFGFFDTLVVGIAPEPQAFR
jgi:hypothetical protein